MQKISIQDGRDRCKPITAIFDAHARPIQTLFPFSPKCSCSFIAVRLSVNACRFHTFNKKIRYFHALPRRFRDKGRRLLRASERTRNQHIKRNPRSPLGDFPCLLAPFFRQRRVRRLKNRRRVIQALPVPHEIHDLFYLHLLFIITA